MYSTETSELPIRAVKAVPARPFSHAESVNLDFLRSAAVLLVFFSHLYEIRGGAGEKWGIAWRLGQLGVLFFFVHTCLVLMWSLERLNLNGGKLFLSFYIRRIFRLYPLSITCVLLAFFFDVRWNHANLWQNLTLTQNLFFRKEMIVPVTVGPIWTLPLEVQMYVLLPMLFLLFRNRSLKLLGVFWTMAVAISFLQPYMGDRWMLLKFIPCFLGGVITWRVMRNGETRKLPGWLWPFAIVPISFVWLLTSRKFLPLNVAGFGLALGLAIPLFREIPWSGLNYATKIVARYSYGIYLSHFAIEIFLFSDPTHPTFRYIGRWAILLRQHGAGPMHKLLFLALSILAPVLLYHLIEAPGIKLGKKVARLI